MRPPLRTGVVVAPLPSDRHRQPNDEAPPGQIEWIPAVARLYLVAPHAAARAARRLPVTLGIQKQHPAVQLKARDTQPSKRQRNYLRASQTRL
ncbi:MAG: hypothetical protein M1118_12385 [Chloroflexi bacterium]|nr:hypothetical protein [Chloroflexota bacterium]